VIGHVGMQEANERYNNLPLLYRPFFSVKGDNKTRACLLSGPSLWSSGQSSWLQNGIVCPVRYELNLYTLCKEVGRLCGLVVRVPDYGAEMYCVS
jgi:hypothetical protein